MSKTIQAKTKHVRVIDGTLYYRHRANVVRIPALTGEVYSTAWGLKNLVQRARNEMRYRAAERVNPDFTYKQKCIHSAISKRRAGDVQKQLIKRQKSLIDQNKSPDTLKTHIGVEIEFISSSDEDDIKEAMARAGLARHVTYHTDGSVRGDSRSDDCDGSCRDECECAYCGETHYCEDPDTCNRVTRDQEGRNARSRWIYREDCTDCTDTETIDDCDCGGKDSEGNSICNGEHVICSGHCEGHSCQGSEDHPDYDCNCECTCGNSSEGHELCIIADQTEIYSVIERVCSVLNDRLGASVNKTCGLHVHLDVRRRNKQTVYNRLKASLPFLMSVVPASRARNSFCKPNTYGFQDTIESGCRYWAINPQSVKRHGTIEVRLHSGTTDSIKINNWVRLLQFLAYQRRICVGVTSFKEMIRQGLPMDTAFYFYERHQKFSADRDGWKPLDSMTQAESTLNERESEAA